MRRSVTDRVLDGLDVRAFYSEFTELSKPSQKGECRGLCPLHKEKTPSFWVNVRDGSFKCFGCGEGGGPIQFWAAVKGLSLFEASAQMLRMYGENENGGNGHRRVNGRKPVEERKPRAAPGRFPLLSPQRSSRPRRPRRVRQEVWLHKPHRLRDLPSLAQVRPTACLAGGRVFCESGHSG